MPEIFIDQQLITFNYQRGKSNIVHYTKNNLLNHRNKQKLEKVVIQQILSLLYARCQGYSCEDSAPNFSVYKICGKEKETEYKKIEIKIKGIGKYNNLKNTPPNLVRFQKVLFK